MMSIFEKKSKKVRANCLKIVSKRVDVATLKIDNQITSQIRDLWKTVGPSPNCPDAGSLMKKIKIICYQGVEARGVAAKEAVLDVTNNIHCALTNVLIDEIIELISRKLPENQYVDLARSTKGVYERRSQSFANKFCDRSFDIEMALIKSSSANLSRRAIGSIKTSLEEMMLKNIVKEPSSSSKILKLFGVIIKWIVDKLFAVFVIILSLTFMPGFILGVFQVEKLNIPISW